MYQTENTKRGEIHRMCQKLENTLSDAFFHAQTDGIIGVIFLGCVSFLQFSGLNDSACRDNWHDKNDSSTLPGVL